ncbi:MAG: FtsX-like permease family protein [Bacteroidota bacterium]
MLGGIILFTIVTGLISGVFPALFISSLEPQRVLKGIWKQGQGGARFRKALVGMQIAIAIFLVIGTVVIFEQLRYIQDRPLGYEKDQVVLLTVRDTKIVKSYYAFKNAMLAESSIRNVSSVSEPIGREVQFMSFDVEGHEATQFVKILNVTHDFVNTMGLEIVKGRDFSRDVSTDSISGFIINEAAAKTFGWEDPIGKAIDHSFRPNKQGRVIGVVKDFNFEPLQKQIDPIVIWFGGPYWYLAINVQQGKTADALVAMEREWKKIEPEKPFQFQFLDQAIQHVYDKEQRLGKVFLVFSILSIATAVIGLWGLISFIAGQRMSEIGIRKVLGASVRNILYLLSKEYLVLVSIAFVIAAPLTWVIISQWLQGFAYKIEWNAIYFVIGLGVTMLIVLSTVMSKGFGAAKANPVDVLKAE